MAEKGDFADAVVGEFGAFHQDILHRAGDLLAAGVGDDAEGAVFAASLHDGDEGGGAAGGGVGEVVEFFNGGEGDIHLRGAGLAASGDEFGEAVEGLGAEDDIHKGGAADDVCALLTGDASADGDEGVWVFALEAADAAEVGEDLFLCFVADGAGVEEDDLRFVRGGGGDGAGAAAEEVRDFGGVVFVHLAAEGADEETRRRPLRVGRVLRDLVFGVHLGYTIAQMGLRIAMFVMLGVLAVGLSGCGGGAGAGGDGSGREFLRELQGRGLTLPSQVSLSDFSAAARGMAITEPEAFLESVGVPVRGEGSGRWVARADLLRACGAECNRREGLGELLVKFSVVWIRNN